MEPGRMNHSANGNMTCVVKEWDDYCENDGLLNLQDWYNETKVFSQSPPRRSPHPEPAYQERRGRRRGGLPLL